MALRAVQINNDNSGTWSYTGSAAIGAFAGYSLKYILPVTSQERNESFNVFCDKITITNMKEEKFLNKLAKSKRSTGLFIFTGIVLALLIAVINNVVARIAAERN